MLCTQCRGIRPHLAARGNSQAFSRVAVGTWHILSSYGGDGHLKLRFIQQTQDPCLVSTDTSGIYTRLGRTILTLLEVRREAKLPFLVGTVILGFLSIFTNSQASSPLEAFNSACLSMCQRDVRPLVEMRWRTTAFCRVSTGDSDILSSYDM